MQIGNKKLINERMTSQLLDSCWGFKAFCNQKHVVHSRAYINFYKAEDVIDFAEFFSGHVFVNEKGAQYKAVVEYAPSQSVPKQWSKKDGREGTIFKDPEYVEFLEFLGKPVEHLPSAEIQLERREAEQAAAGKEALIITPLMQFIRQKRAASSGSRRSLNNGKSVRRIGRRSSDSPCSVSSKQSERRRVSTTMVKLPSTGNLRPIPRSETGGKIIKNILQPDRLIQSSQVEKDTQSQSSNIRILSKSRNGVLDDKISASDIKVVDKSERRTRNKDRPDRGVWTPVRKSDGLHRSDESLSSASQSMQIPPPSSEGSRGEQKVDNASARSEVKVMVIARNLHSSIENGSSVHVSRRRLAQGRKDTDVNIHEGKSARRGTSSSYNSHEKQVWVQKSSASS